MDNCIIDIIDKAVAGGRLNPEEIGRLYSLDIFSPEAYLVRWAGRKMSMEASGGLAEIHAQIGLNAAPCPKNCHFCSFAACNRVSTERVETPLEDVVEYARIYEEQGANLILMLSTANYPVDRFLEAAYAVRRVISPEMPLLANIDDFGIDTARSLKQAGINGVYHAIRMGEGVVTGISKETRMATIEAVRQAGLKLCTCVEPIGPEHTVEELVEATLLSRDLGAVFSGAGRRITVPGTKMDGKGMLTASHIGFYAAVYRLASGYECALNCAVSNGSTLDAGTNIAWAEVGTNPRDVAKKTEDGGRGHSIAGLRKMFEDANWEVRRGFSPGWEV